jgi:hypothetical protein
MQRQLHRKNSRQLEFSALVEAAESASREIAAQRKAQRRLAREQRDAVRLLHAPKGSKHGFNRPWMNAVTMRIRQSFTLREGIVFAASRLSELLDLEIELANEDPEWREKYDAFCDYKKSVYSSSEEDTDKMICMCWEFGRELFEIYYSINTINDWSLFEHFAPNDDGNNLSADFLVKQASRLDHCAEVVWWIHLLITNVAPDDGAEERRSDKA